MRRRQEQMLDAHGETQVTKFVIGRHRHEAVDMLKDAVGRQRHSRISFDGNAACDAA